MKLHKRLQCNVKAQIPIEFCIQLCYSLSYSIVPEMVYGIFPFIFLFCVEILPTWPNCLLRNITVTPSLKELRHTSCPLGHTFISNFASVSY